MSETPNQDVSAIPVAWASSVGWRANQLMSAEQYRQCLPKNRADFDVPLYGPDALDNYRRLADENQQDAARFRMLLQQHKHWLGIFRCDPDGAPSDSLDHVELKALLDQLIAPMCVWCEERVPGACKSHYETLTCERRVIVPTAEEWAGAEAHALKYALYRLADAAEALGVNHFGDDWRSDQVQELQAATHAARLALGPNAELSGAVRRPLE